MRRAGGGSGAERRSRNSVRARSCALGSGAPVAVWPRARTRVASPAFPTPLEYPGEGASSPVHESTRCAYFGREKAQGRVGRAARALAAVLWWWCVALLRLVALCAPSPGPPPRPGAPPPPPARAAEDAPAATAAACASALANTTEPAPAPSAAPPPPTSHAHTEWWWAGACVGAAVLLCAAGALARPHLRRRHAAAAAAATNPMLSVQVPGCAGMERLGAPGGPRLRHDHRHHHSALEWEKQRLQAMVQARLQEMVEQETRARSAAAAERLGLPPSIQLPDGEYGQDAHLQLRAPYQQDELTRTNVQPPPNKSVTDVPEWAGVVDTGARRGGSKKDGLLQKATRWWVRMGARAPAPLLPVGATAASAPPCVMVPPTPPGAPGQPPCVMVPRRAQPDPPPDA